jgi:hypothetical protein
MVGSRHLVALLASLSSGVLSAHRRHLEHDQAVETLAAQRVAEKADLMALAESRSRMLKMHKSVCKEAVSFLDPPLLGKRTRSLHVT